MRYDAERIWWPRGTTIVVRPLDGGQGCDEFVDMFFSSLWFFSTGSNLWLGYLLFPRSFVLLWMLLVSLDCTTHVGERSLLDGII